MIPVQASQLGIDECRTVQEKEFIEQLNSRAIAASWIPYNCFSCDEGLVLYLDQSDKDPRYNTILRTLRIDFFGDRVRYGKDETGQLATPLDPTRSDVSEVLSESPLALASIAADWLEREFAREFLRYEWDRLDARGVAPRAWDFAETRQCLVYRGERTPDFGPPDRIVKVLIQNGVDETE